MDIGSNIGFGSRCSWDRGGNGRGRPATPTIRQWQESWKGFVIQNKGSEEEEEAVQGMRDLIKTITTPGDHLSLNHGPSY